MLFRSPKPQTPNPKPQTPNPKPQIQNLFLDDPEHNRGFGSCKTSSDLRRKFIWAFGPSQLKKDSCQGLTRSRPDSGIWELSDTQLVVHVVLSLAVVGLRLGVDSIPNVVGQAPAYEGPESPVGYFGVENVGVDVEEPVSLVGADSPVPVSGRRQLPGVGSEPLMSDTDNPNRIP